MKYLRIIENMANDLDFNGIDFNIILTIVIVVVIGIYLYVEYFSYWFNPFHKHKVNQTVVEYYQHIKEKHPDIWKEYNLTEEGIKKISNDISMMKIYKREHCYMTRKEYLHHIKEKHPDIFKLYRRGIENES